jgi:hypothetical protein
MLKEAVVANFKVQTDHASVGTWNLRQDNQFLYQNSKTRPPEYEANYTNAKFGLQNKDVSVFNEVPRHADVWGLEVWLHAFLTSALDGSG